MRFNFTRPLLLIAVALFANSVTKLILGLAGVAPETADSISYMVMIVAAIVTFIVLNKNRRKR